MNKASSSNHPSAARRRRARPALASSLACVTAAGACSFRDLDHFQDGTRAAGGTQASGGVSIAGAVNGGAVVAGNVNAAAGSGNLSGDSTAMRAGGAGASAKNLAGAAVTNSGGAVASTGGTLAASGGADSGSSSLGGATFLFGGAFSTGGKATGGSGNGEGGTAGSGNSSLGPWTFDTEAEISTWLLQSQLDGVPGPGTTSWIAQGEAAPVGSLVVKSTGEVALWYYLSSSSGNLSGRTLCMRGRTVSGTALVKVFAFSPGSQWADGGEVTMQTTWQDACLEFSRPAYKFSNFDPANLWTFGIQIPNSVAELWIDRIWLS